MILITGARSVLWVGLVMVASCTAMSSLTTLVCLVARWSLRCTVKNVAPPSCLAPEGIPLVAGGVWGCWMTKVGGMIKGSSPFIARPKMWWWRVVPVTIWAPRPWGCTLTKAISKLCRRCIPITVWFLRLVIVVSMVSIILLTKSCLWHIRRTLPTTLFTS